VAWPRPTTAAAAAAAAAAATAPMAGRLRKRSGGRVSAIRHKPSIKRSFGIVEGCLDLRELPAPGRPEGLAWPAPAGAGAAVSTPAALSPTSTYHPRFTNEALNAKFLRGCDVKSFVAHALDNGAVLHERCARLTTHGAPVADVKALGVVVVVLALILVLHVASEACAGPRGARAMVARRRDGVHLIIG